MVKSSYRFDGSSFTGQKYVYVGPSSSPCRKTTGPVSVEMVSKDANWAISGNSYMYGLQRGVFAGGLSGGKRIIEYINIPTTGNSIEYGELALARDWFTACSSSTRGVFIGGQKDGDDQWTNLMDYINFTTGGRADAFGLILAPTNLRGSCSNEIYGVFNAADVPDPSQSLQYITISTTSYSQFFGDLESSATFGSGCGSYSRGLFMSCGNTGVETWNVRSIDIGTSGSSSTFGDLYYTTQWNSNCCSSPTRALNAGGLNLGATLIRDISSVQIASSGNMTDFGYLSIAKSYLACSSSHTRGTFGGGDNNEGTLYTAIEYVEIATYGDSQNFGDLSVSSGWGYGCSSCHGGIQ